MATIQNYYLYGRITNPNNLIFKGDVMSAYTDMYKTGKKNKQNKKQNAQGQVQDAQNDFGMKQSPSESQR